MNYHFNTGCLHYRIVICITFPENSQHHSVFLIYRLIFTTTCKLKGWRKAVSQKRCRLYQLSSRNTANWMPQKACPWKTYPDWASLCKTDPKCFSFSFNLTLLFQNFCDSESPVCVFPIREYFCLQEWFRLITIDNTSVWN